MDAATQTAIDQMNDCKYLNVTSVEVVAGYGLCIVVEELIPRRSFPENPERDYVPELAKKIRAEMAAEIIPITRSFEINFKEFISYVVANECYGKYPEPPENFTGKLFRVFSWSYLLEWARKTTYASADHPGPEKLMHFEIVGQDEILGVIACVYPKIKMTLSHLE